MKNWKGNGKCWRSVNYVFTPSKSANYKSFIKPHLDYGDVTYDQPSNTIFSSNIEPIQYNAALAITVTGAIKGSSLEKLHQD